MGAHEFYVDSHGTTATEAFSTAVTQAQYDYGHDPYNGTISTNENFIMKPLQEGETIREWQDRMLDDDDVRKWGPCACVQDPDDPQLWHFAGWAAT